VLFGSPICCLEGNIPSTAIEKIDLCLVDTFVGRLGRISVLLGSLSAGGPGMSLRADPGTRTIRLVSLRRC